MIFQPTSGKPLYMITQGQLGFPPVIDERTYGTRPLGLTSNSSCGFL